MTDTVKAFLERVNNLEADKPFIERYRDGHYETWLMPREMMFALRDEVKNLSELLEHIDYEGLVGEPNDNLQKDRGEISF